jgi:hypothetical protein
VSAFPGRSCHHGAGNGLKSPCGRPPWAVRADPVNHHRYPSPALFTPYARYSSVRLLAVMGCHLFSLLFPGSQQILLA